MSSQESRQLPLHAQAAVDVRGAGPASLPRHVGRENRSKLRPNGSLTRSEPAATLPRFPNPNERSLPVLPLCFFYLGMRESLARSQLRRRLAQVHESFALIREPLGGHAGALAALG